MSKIRGIYTAEPLLSLDSLPASFYYLNFYLSIINIPARDGGILWIQAKSRVQSPTSGQHAKYAHILL